MFADVLSHPRLFRANEFRAWPGYIASQPSCKQEWTVHGDFDCLFPRGHCLNIDRLDVSSRVAPPARLMLILSIHQV
jgi:hypothetical protein